MQWDDFRAKRVALLGAGLENLGLIPHLVKAQASIFLCDRSAENISEDFARQYPMVKVIVGPNYLQDLGKYDYVFRIAGLPVATLEKALSGIKSPPVVTSPTDLFLALKPCQIIGVTGTKGKGTTATMIGEILQAAGHRVFVVGNIGKPIFSIYDDLSSETFAVIELSSFQLEDVHHSPETAVVLPISQDHLQPLSETNPNYHLTMNDYVAAKSHVTLYQTEKDRLIFAADNPDSTAIASISKAKKIAVSQSAYQNHWNVDGQGNVYQSGEKLLALTELGLQGQHIFLNATIAVATVTELGIELAAIKEGLKAFKPLPHRLQDLGEKGGIRFVDDSYATNPDAAIAALTAFSQPVVLIAGGSPKGVDFTDFAQAIADSTVKSVVLIGQEAPRIRQALQAHPSVNVIDGGASMAEAVTRAHQQAVAGDVVLLSPGCASKDMFKNAAERGDLFQAAVAALQ